MLQIMTELQKKILEQSIIVVILAALVWYLNEQLRDQKSELRLEIQSIANRLNSCETDRYNLAIEVAQMKAVLGNFSPSANRPTKKAK
jgi:hypothetical protein